MLHYWILANTRSDAALRKDGDSRLLLYWIMRRRARRLGRFSDAALVVSRDPRRASSTGFYPTELDDDDDDDEEEDEEPAPRLGDRRPAADDEEEEDAPAPRLSVSPLPRPAARPSARSSRRLSSVAAPAAGAAAANASAGEPPLASSAAPPSPSAASEKARGSDSRDPDDRDSPPPQDEAKAEADDDDEEEEDDDEPAPRIGVLRQRQRERKAAAEAAADGDSAADDNGSAAADDDSALADGEHASSAAVSRRGASAAASAAARAAAERADERALDALFAEVRRATDEPMRPRDASRARMVHRMTSEDECTTSCVRRRKNPKRRRPGGPLFLRAGRSAPRRCVMVWFVHSPQCQRSLSSVFSLCRVVELCWRGCLRTDTNGDGMVSSDGHITVI